MKPDLYTKAILTIIAVCLLYAVVRKEPEAVRADGPMPVVITGVELSDAANVLPVGIAASSRTCFTSTTPGTSTLCSWGYDPLPVKVK
jgi:hypothetical protein